MTKKNDPKKKIKVRTIVIIFFVFALGLAGLNAVEKNSGDLFSNQNGNVTGSAAEDVSPDKHERVAGEDSDAVIPADLGHNNPDGTYTDPNGQIEEGIDRYLQNPDNYTTIFKQEIADGRYVQKNNIQTFLFMGTDAVKDSSRQEEAGCVDTLFLLVINHTENVYTILNLDRNTIAYFGVYDEETEEYLGESVGQISYGYTFANGGITSAKNAAAAVSEFLCNQPIDGVFALRRNAIQTVNHVLGGVTVTIEDDFSNADSSLIKGETVKLTDSQAETFVRGRMNVGDGENTSRMRRQMAYLESAKSNVIAGLKNDPDYINHVTEQLDKYLVTDMTYMDYSKLGNAVLEYEFEGFQIIDGVSVIGNHGFVEFYPDRQSLKNSIVQLFYNEK